MKECCENDECYFGEEYYSENCQSSDESMDDLNPYYVAEQLHRMRDQNQVTQYPQYTDSQDLVRKQKKSSVI